MPKARFETTRTHAFRVETKPSHVHETNPTEGTADQAVSHLVDGHDHNLSQERANSAAFRGAPTPPPTPPPQRSPSLGKAARREAVQAPIPPAYTLFAAADRAEFDAFAAAWGEAAKGNLVYRGDPNYGTVVHLPFIHSHPSIQPDEHRALMDSQQGLLETLFALRPTDIFYEGSCETKTIGPAKAGPWNYDIHSLFADWRPGIPLSEAQKGYLADYQMAYWVYISLTGASLTVHQTTTPEIQQRLVDIGPLDAENVRANPGFLQHEREQFIVERMDAFFRGSAGAGKTAVLIAGLGHTFDQACGPRFNPNFYVMNTTVFSDQQIEAIRAGLRR